MYFHFENKETPIDTRIFTELTPTPHLHTHIELIRVEGGDTVAFADNRSGACRKGDVFIAFPNQIHYYHDGEPPTGDLLIFSPELVPEFGEVFGGQVPVSPVLPGAGEDPKVRECLRELLRLEGEPRDLYREPLVRAYLLILCSRLLPRMELAPAVKCDTDTLKAVIQYCTENYSREISLQTLSDSLYISKYYISHLFGQRLKVSFCDYINALRVRRACELLRQGGLSVTEVAFAVGYNSTRSFDRCFKKIQKVSPQSYRLRKGSQAVSGAFSNRA